MFATIRSGTLGAFGALALASSSVFAAPVAWTQSSGTTGDITFSNGQSDKGLFGDPVFNGNSFLFFPNNFTATSSNGVAQTTSDRLSFTISVAPSKSIQQVHIKELGDWSILGGGSVKATGTLFVTKLNTPGFGSVWSDNLDTTYNDEDNSVSYSSPLRPVSDGGGDWSGDFYITLPAGVTSAQIVLNNILQATSAPTGTSFIQKKEVGESGEPGNTTPQFLISVAVPEPASLGVIALAGVALLRRQRKAIPSTTTT
jgi:hypothetical protein